MKRSNRGYLQLKSFQHSQSSFDEDSRLVVPIQILPQTDNGQEMAELEQGLSQSSKGLKAEGPSGVNLWVPNLVIP